MKRIWILVGVVVLLGLVVYATAGRGRPASAAKDKAGDTNKFVSPAAAARGRWAAPDFELTDLDGRSLKLSALRGKVVLLDFWATWCPPCVAEVPHFRALQTEHGPKGFEVIGLSLDDGSEEKAVRSFARAQGIRYRLAMGTPQIAQAYGGIRGIPTTFLIDKKGNVAKKYVGYREKSEFDQQIRSLLAE